MRLRYAGICRVCGVELPANTNAVYEGSNKTVRCVVHDSIAHDPAKEPEPIDAGVPGVSARREFERRRARRAEGTKVKHPKLGGIVLALGEEPQSTRAWATGALGEERLGARLNELASDLLRILHDRRIPGTAANIDHLAVAPTGVFVIDAKKYKGRPQLKVEGGVLRPRVEKLLVGSRNCTKVVDGVLKQVQVVRGILSEDVPIHGVLCFVEADWPLIGGSFKTRGVEALWPKKLYSRLQGPGPLDQQNIDKVHRLIASALPRA